MKIIVIEDNHTFNKILCKNISKTLINHNYDYDIRSFTEYNHNLRKIIYDRDIKIYIIDLELGSVSGYDIINEIRKKSYDWDSIIIISSVHNQKEDLISRRLAIFTYISKFLDFEENLENSLLEAIHIFERKKLLTINKSCKILINDICYILKEKGSKYCVVKTINDEFRVRKSLKSLMEELHFKKIKNYILINEHNVVFSNKNIIKFKNKLEIRVD